MADSEDSRERHRAYKRAWKRAWSAANRDKKNAQLRAWRADAPEKAREAWRRAHVKEKSNPYRYAFNNQRRGARERGIPFLLTYEEWMSVWNESGKWSQRGTKKGCYVMARTGDIGPYAVGNIRICLSGENISERHLGKQVSKETRLRMSEAAKGKKATEPQLAALARGRVTFAARCRAMRGG